MEKIRAIRAQMLNSIYHFVNQLETTLKKHDIEAGQHPASNVRPEHWEFLSYRNES